MSPHNSEGSRQLLAELESLLTQPIEPTRAEVEAAHGAATKAIRRVNDRLANVHQLIAAGRRAEGIEIAEGPPHVLDEIAIFDSQLIRDWEHWSGQFGLPRLAPLRNDLASLLNGAYTAENQLEHLLRRHRLLAIGRANLRQRIAVLSQLAAADPSNPQWNKGLALCQRYRLEQLSERSSRARKLSDLRGLQQIMAELRQTRWLTPISKAQVDAVQKQIDLLQSRESTNEAIALGEHIQDAYAAGDQTRLTPLIVRWRQIESNIDAQAMSDVLPQIRSVADWFDQEQQARRDAAAQSLALQRVGSIKSDAEAAEIRSVIEGIASTGAEVPMELRESYIDRVRKESKSKRMRAGLVTGAIALALLGITTIAALTYRSYQREAALTSMIDAIDLKLASGDLGAVANLLNTAPRDDERFHDFREQLSEKQLAEKLRDDQYIADGQELRDALDKAKRLEEFSTLAIRVSRWADRAKKDDEFVVAKELTEFVSARRAQRKNEVAQSTNQLIVEIREGLKTLVPDSGARQTLTDWNQQVQTARTDAWIREESQLLQRLGSTSDAIADRRESIRERADVEKSLASITRSVGDWDAWESIGNSANEQDAIVKGKFRAIADRTREERELWSGIEQWNEIVPLWTVDQILSAGQQLARQIKPDMDKVLQARLQDLPAARDFLAACQVAMPTASRGERTLETIVAHLQSSKMQKINGVKIATTDSSLGQWYYFPISDDSLLPRGDGLRLKYYTDLAMIDTDTDTFPFSSIKVPADFEERKTEYLEGSGKLLAPHVAFCKKLLRQLQELQQDSSDWDQVFVQSHRQLLSMDQIDPIVQLFLVTALLDIGSQASWKFATAYGEHFKTVQDAHVSIDVNWINPTDENAAQSRKQALAVLDKLREMGLVNPSPQLEKMKQSLAINTKYVPVGWLDQDNGQWIVRTAADTPEDGELYVRFEGSGSNTTSTIGKLSGGTVSLSDTSGPAMRLGRPVWLGQPVSTTKAGAQTSEKSSR